MRGYKIFCCALAASLLAALGSPVEAARAGAILNMPHDVRSDSLGAGFAALAETAGGAHANPAGLGFVKRPEVSLLYSPYLLGTRVTALSLAYPGTLLGGLGAGFLSFQAGGFEGRDDQGNRTGSFSAEDRVLRLSWAGSLWAPPEAERGPGGAGSFIGMSLKLLQSRLADVRAQVLTADAGMVHRMDALPLSVGLAVRSLGPGFSYLAERERPPAELALGLAYAPRALPFHLVGGIAVGIGEEKMEVGLGTEIKLGGALVLRGGYRMSDPSQATNSPNGVHLLTGGFGLKLSDYRLDGSITPLGELGMVSKFSLTVEFGGPAKGPGLPKRVRKLRKADKPRSRQNPDPSAGYILW